MRLILNQARMDLNPSELEWCPSRNGANWISEVRFKGDTDRAEKYIKGSLQPEDIADIIHFSIQTPIMLILI
jgi:NADP-dependent 3-hydroxy acid dehydrogenase YdfG